MSKRYEYVFESVGEPSEEALFRACRILWRSTPARPVTADEPGPAAPDHSLGQKASRIEAGKKKGIKKGSKK